MPSDERSPENDKRVQAKKDLYFLIEALKEIGATWTTALTSAGVLEGEFFFSARSVWQTLTCLRHKMCCSDRARL